MKDRKDVKEVPVEGYSVSFTPYVSADPAQTMLRASSNRSGSRPLAGVLLHSLNKLKGDLGLAEEAAATAMGSPVQGAATAQVAAAGEADEDVPLSQRVSGASSRGPSSARQKEDVEDEEMKGHGVSSSQDVLNGIPDDAEIQDDDSRTVGVGFPADSGGGAATTE